MIELPTDNRMRYSLRLTAGFCLVLVVLAQIAVPASANDVAAAADLAANGIHTGRTTGGSGMGSMDVTLAVNRSGAAISQQFLYFSGPLGLAPIEQAVSLSAAAGAINYFAVQSHPWIQVSPTSGLLPQTVTVTVNPAGLSATTYLGHIDFFFSDGGAGRVDVIYTVGGSSGTGEAVSVAPAQLVFEVQYASSVAPSPQAVVVYGKAGSAFNASAGASSGGNWLSISPSAGEAPAGIAVSVDNAVAAALSSGVYQGTVTVKAAAETHTVAVILRVHNDPVLQVRPGSATIYYDPAAATAAQPVYFIPMTTDGQARAFSATSSVPWLQIYRTSSHTPSPFAATVSVVGLPEGVSEGAIVLTAEGVANSPLTIPVTVVTGGAPNAFVSPRNLSLAVQSGGTPAAKTLTVDTGTASYFTASASSTGNWLSVTPTSGWTPRDLVVSAASSSLAAGTYSGTITVTCGGVSQTVNVTLTVGAGTTASLVVGDVSPVFDYQKGGATPASQTIGVSSTGGQLSFTASATSSGNWLQVSPASGNTQATLTVSLNQQNLQNLAPGTHTGSITVTGGGNSYTRSVTLTVRQSASLNLSPNALSFNWRTDGAFPGPQTLTVNSTGSALQYSAASNATWLQVSNATGTTPGSLSVSVNPAGLNSGQYTGRITVATTGSTPASSTTIDVTLTVTRPLPTVTGITNAASYLQGPIAPGELVTLFGTAIGPAELTTLKLDSEGRVATTLEGVRVLFNGVPAPMIYVSAGQVSAIVPYSMAGRMTASVWLEYRGVRSNAMTVDAAPVKPAIFTANASGSGPGAILNQDWTLNSASNGAARGSIVMLYVTGEGQMLPVGVDGKVNDNPDALPKPVLDVTVTIDGKPAPVHYAGAAPGMVCGVMQVNVEIPAAAASGAVPLVVSVGGVTSQPGVTVAVQ